MSKFLGGESYLKEPKGRYDRDMRFRVSLLVLLFVVSSLALPLVAHAAAIPFLGPIIPDGYQTCPAGWGALLIVVNNIIRLLITLAIVLVAPLMISWAGFLLVVNPFNSGAKEQAKKILTNTIVGIVIALAGWMIVNALMVVLYNPDAQSGTTKLTAWTQLITSGSAGFCLKQAGAPHQAGTPTQIPSTVVVVGVACSVPVLSPITDSLALQMESGTKVIWTNTDPRLQACVNKFIGLVGSGTVNSAYRPQAYQTHLWEIKDRWCSKGLKDNTSSVCSALKTTVSTERIKHFGSVWSCGAVAATNSTHGSGIGVDISGINHSSTAVQQAASQSCLTWKNYSGDPYHYDLKPSPCTCS